MGCIIEFFLIPLHILCYMLGIVALLFKSLFELIIGLLNIGNTNLKKITPKQKKKDISQFDKESELWSLSNEDKRIAKEERMTPADYIEAEERNDDNLDTDD